MKIKLLNEGNFQCSLPECIINCWSFILVYINDFFFLQGKFSTFLPSQAGTTKLQINVKKLKKRTKVFYLFDLIKDGRLT